MFTVGIETAVRAEEIGLQFDGVKFLRIQRTKVYIFFVILAIMADFTSLVVLVNRFLKIGFRNA